MPKLSSLRLKQSLNTYGAVIAPVAHSVSVLQHYKALHDQPVRLTRSETRLVKEEMEYRESNQVRGGVNFSRIQIDELWHAKLRGDDIEFEAIGPYIADYLPSCVMVEETLLPEDAIGLALARVFRELFPRGRLVALCDDYNTVSAHNQHTGTLAADSTILSEQSKENFKASLVTLFEAAGALGPSSKAERDYLLLDESARVADAPALVDRLERAGRIRRNGHEISFVNNQAENPLCQRFTLRTGQGRWLCEALDAASFLKPRNQTITHIVALPSYMKTQQDRVWEILRLLDILPHRYHNLFYEPDGSPENIAMTVKSAFSEQIPLA